MNVFSWLYEIIIGPLELSFEIIFSLAYRLLGSPGIAIIILSLCMNFLLMPLYMRTDAIQEEARNTEARMKKGVAHIKKTFQGNERVMMLEWFYHLNHYRPTDVLKGSVSLLLEIPFFIAAYNFLSHLALLQGVSFGPVQDLSAPDGLLVIAGLSINVLPILMTVINLCSSAIYTKGLPLSSKIQLYGMAGLFLILLYDSPSGLVLYWTLNNLFSLVKNGFVRLKKPGLILSILSSAAGAAMLIVILFVAPRAVLSQQLLLVFCALLFQVPLILQKVKARTGVKKGKTVEKPGKKDSAPFYLGCLLLALLTGLLVPSAVMADSPQEFVNTYTMQSPLIYLLGTGLRAAGLFLVWPSVFYALATPDMKRSLCRGVWIFCGIALIDYLFFGKDYGRLYATLRFESYHAPGLMSCLINTAVIFLAAGILWLLSRKKPGVMLPVCITLVLTVAVMGSVNMAKIHIGTEKMLERDGDNTNVNSYIKLSKQGKNVCIFMMDRSINNYIPYIFAEKPEVATQFEGFTYYPNTISYGAFTNVGTPALFGGYEYRPKQMNARASEPLVEKHNEALLVMPLLFSQNDFRVTVCDPAYAGYNWIPDLSIYAPYPEIEARFLMDKLTDDPDFQSRVEENIKDYNFFCYSLFRISPVLTHHILYNYGEYNRLYSIEDQELFSQKKAYTGQTRQSPYQSTGIDFGFMVNFQVLQKLTDITEIMDDDRDYFFVTDNETTHAPMLLQEPEYLPSERVDNRAYHQNDQERFTLNGRTMRMENENQIIHYHANMASYTEIGQWLDYLRENDVYDNTRIIIVSDHGSNLHQFDDMRFGKDFFEDAMFYNPILMVKDFDSKEFKVDDRFMTNADVPTLAMEGLIQDPVNPFTDQPINSDPKTQEKEQFILSSNIFSVYENNGNTFLPGNWISVHDNIYDMDNWKVVERNP